MMKKKPVFVAINAPKGGIGKSTFTTLIASQLHYGKGVRVAVVDADSPQHSVYALREREIQHVRTSDRHKLKMAILYEGIERQAYPVLRSDSENALRDFQNYYDKSAAEIDVVFFDLPGTIFGSGIVSTIAAMDYLFIPIKADRMVIQSCLQFARAVKMQFIGNEASSLKDLYFFWNMIDKRERTPLYDQYDTVIDTLGLKRLSTHIPDRRKYNRDISESPQGIFRSTLFPADSRMEKNSLIAELTDEIQNIIKPL